MFSFGINVIPSFVKIDYLIQKSEWEHAQTTQWSYESTSFASGEETRARQEWRCEVALTFPTSPIRTTLALPLWGLQKRCAVNGTPLHAALNFGDEIQHWYVTRHQWQWQMRASSLFTQVPGLYSQKKKKNAVSGTYFWYLERLIYCVMMY